MEEVNTKFGALSIGFAIFSFFFFWIPIIGLITSILAIYFFFKQRKIGDTVLSIFGCSIAIFTLMFSILINIVLFLAVLNL